MNKRGQETREHIRECACSLFAEKGFKQVTMKDICEAADLSRGGLYCHYESTQQIFREIIDNMMSRQEDEFSWKMRQGQSAVTILEEVLDRYKKEMIDTQSSLSLAIYEYYSMKGNSREENTLYNQYLLSANMWKNLIRYGISRGEFRDVNASSVFDLIVFSYQGVRMYSRLMRVDESIPAGIVMEIKNILLRKE